MLVSDWAFGSTSSSFWAFFCPTAGIGVTRDGTTLYANHERLNVFEPEECAPAQEEFNKEEKNKKHATVSSVTAKLTVNEPPTLAEPTVQALDNDFTTAIAVDQSEGQQASGNVYLDNQEQSIEDAKRTYEHAYKVPHC